MRLKWGEDGLFPVIRGHPQKVRDLRTQDHSVLSLLVRFDAVLWSVISLTDNNRANEVSYRMTQSGKSPPPSFDTLSLFIMQWECGAINSLPLANEERGFFVWEMIMSPPFPAMKLHIILWFCPPHCTPWSSTGAHLSPPSALTLEGSVRFATEQPILSNP